MAALGGRTLEISLGVSGSKGWVKDDMVGIDMRNSALNRTTSKRRADRYPSTPRDRPLNVSAGDGKIVAACLSTTAKVKITRGGSSHDAGIQALSWNSRREHNQPVEFDLKGRKDRVLDRLYFTPTSLLGAAGCDQPPLHLHL